MSYTTLKCYLQRKDFSSDEEYEESLKKFFDNIRENGYTVISYPDAGGYFYVERNK